MAARQRNKKASSAPSDQDRILEAIRAGFAAQARTSTKILTAIHRGSENLDAWAGT